MFMLLHKPLLWCGLNLAISFYEFWEIWAFLVAQMVKSLPAVWETWVRSLGLEDPMDGGAWKATVHGIAKNQIQLSNFSLFLFLFLYEFSK